MIVTQSLPPITMSQLQITQVQVGVGGLALHWKCKRYGSEVKWKPLNPPPTAGSMDKAEEQFSSLHTLVIYRLGSRETLEGSWSDPFKQLGKLPALKTLKLVDYPAPAPTSEVTTLTGFELHCDAVSTPMEISTFLGRNPLIERLVLYNTFPDNLQASDHPDLQCRIELDKLKHLWVEGSSPTDLDHLTRLICCVTLPKGLHVRVKLDNMTLDVTLPFVDRFAKQPTHLRMDCPEENLEFSVNEIKVTVFDIPLSEMDSALTVKPLSFFDKVESLHLVFSEQQFNSDSTLSETPQGPSILFPALQTLTIEEGGISTTFCAPFTFPSFPFYKTQST